MSLFGIDLGTTNSCIARYDEATGEPVVLNNALDACDFTASAVFFERESDNVIVGKTAKESAITDPDRVVQFAKRRMGEDGYSWRIDEKEWNPIEISALILKRLCAYAAEQSGEDVRDVVITCPAYFGLKERAATKSAGEAIELNVIDLINEPTAAALSYYNHEYNDACDVFVYDLGGGTFDISAIHMEPQGGKRIVNVIATAGDHCLGGKDWDDALYRLLVDLFESNYQELDFNDGDLSNSLKQKVEQTKISLTQSEAKKVKINWQGKPYEISVTREAFVNETASLLGRTIDLCKSVKNDPGVAGMTLSKILMVGGSSRMPAVREALEKEFPGIEIMMIDPDMAVAKGAAIAARIGADLIIHNPVPDLTGPEPPLPPSGPTDIGIGIGIVDKTPRSFGVGVQDSESPTKDFVVYTMIFKNENLQDGKLVRVDQFGTSADNMSRIIIPAYEHTNTDSSQVALRVDWASDDHTTINEYTNRNSVRYLGKLEMAIEPNQPQDTPIGLEMTMRTSGLTLKAWNMATNSEPKSCDIDFIKEGDKPDKEKVGKYKVDGE